MVGSSGEQESRQKKSYCRLCTAYCALDVEVEAGRVRSVRGDASDPVSGGYSCLKGRQIPHQIHGPQRLRSSLVRRPDGSYEPIASEQALDEIATRIQALIETHGPRSVASFGGTAAFANSATMPVVRAWHRGVGSISNYSTLTIDQPAKIVATARHGVWGGGGHSFASSDVALALGINPIVSGLSMPGGVPGTNPVKTLREATKRGLKLICVDPRRSELARSAHLHLQVRPGEDATLLAGMLRVILRQNLHDADFCRDHADGLAALRRVVTDFTPDYVERRADVPARQMIEAARLFAAGPRGYASSGTGVDMSRHPRLTAHLICCLNTICGRHNRVGERIANPGVLSLPVPRPAQAIPPQLLPPILSWGEGPESRFRGLGGSFHEMPSATLAEEIDTPGDGQIRGLISVGANPCVAMPNPIAMRKAFETLELSVSIDITLSETSRRADYVIAARHALEREDVTEFMDPFYEVPYAHYARAAIESPGDAVEDWEVFIGLARRLGTKIDLPGGSIDVEHPPNKFELLQLIFPATRIALERLREHEGGNVYDELDIVVSEPLPGIEARLQLAPADVDTELRELRAEPIGPQSDGHFTHRLICRRLPHVVNSVGRDFPQSAKHATANPAFVNADDLRELGMSSGELIEIESQNGCILAQAESSDEVRRGVISMAHCFGDDELSRDGVLDHGSNTGLLIATDRDYDPITGMPRQSAIPVRIRAPGE